MTRNAEPFGEGDLRLHQRPSRFDGRLIVAAALLSCMVTVCMAGWSVKAWRWMGVLSVSPQFTDARAITCGWDSWRMGCDPLYENPGHPQNAFMNYPRLWLVPSALGLGGKDTTVLVCCALAAFWSLSFLLIGRLTPGEGCLYALLLCSPSALLAVERGNCDLVLFSLIACAVLLMQLRPAFGYGLVLVAGFLKLYPIFALSIALRESRRLAFITIGVVGGAFFGYVVLTLPDMVEVWKVSSHSGVGAYGFLTFAYKIEDSLGFRGLHPGGLQWLSELGIAIVVMVSALSVRSGLRVRQTPPGSSRELDAFRAGASIYAGSFLLGSNYDYRLIFLLFTVPQLLIWIKERKETRVRSTRILWCIIAAMWCNWPVAAVPNLRRLVIPVAEVVNWALFALMVTLLVATLPEWVSDMVETAMPMRRPRAAVA